MRLDLEAYDDTTQSSKVLAPSLALIALCSNLLSIWLNETRQARALMVLGICVKEIYCSS